MSRKGKKMHQDEGNVVKVQDQKEEGEERKKMKTVGVKTIATVTMQVMVMKRVMKKRGRSVQESVKTEKKRATQATTHSGWPGATVERSVVHRDGSDFECSMGDRMTVPKTDQNRATIVRAVVGKRSA